MLHNLLCLHLLLGPGKYLFDQRLIKEITMQVFHESMQGGLKAVLWTDVFQAGIMLLSLAVIVGKGVTDVGGLDLVWQRVSDGDRLRVLK